MPARLLQHTQLFVTLWTAARLAPLSMGFSRQECWSGLPCPLPVDLSDPGMEPASLMPPAWAGVFFTTSDTCEASLSIWKNIKVLNEQYGRDRISLLKSIWI